MLFICSLEQLLAGCSGDSSKIQLFEWKKKLAGCIYLQGLTGLINSLLEKMISVDAISVETISGDAAKAYKPPSTCLVDKGASNWVQCFFFLSDSMRSS